MKVLLAFVLVFVVSAIYMYGLRKSEKLKTRIWSRRLLLPATLAAIGVGCFLFLALNTTMKVI